MIRLFSIFLLFLISSPAWATNWYVRDGGANYGITSTTCNGQTNSVYKTGNGPNCAVNHPAWILGVGGYSGGTNPRKMASGDTLYIDGDSDINPGQQAVYNVGYSMPNSGGICNTAGEYNCYMLNVVAGTSGQWTSIIGIGNNKPLLLSVNRPYHVLQVQNNYVNLQWLEIASHDSCATNDPSGGCTGYIDTDGLQLSSPNATLTDIYIHGFPRYGIYGAGNFGNVIFTRVWTIGNGFGGIDIGADGTESVTGTLTFNQPIVEWNGCIEGPYPLVGGIDNPSNYKNCFGQDSGGYGDGLAFGATGTQTAGNWTLIGPGSISFNTQDGLDIYHGAAGEGTDNIDKMRFEGNAGQQIKITGLVVNVTNSVIIGDCGWWYKASQSLSGGMQPGDSCRASGSTMRFSLSPNSAISFYNNTILTNAIAFETVDGGTGCNGSTMVNSMNNIILGGYTWDDDSSIVSGGGNSQTTNVYNDGNNGNGGGTCGNIQFSEDYNIVYGNKNSNSQCSGAHDQCGVYPTFIAGNFPMGTAGGGLSTYYRGQAGVTLIPIANSPAGGTGLNGLTYWNTPNDYYNTARPNPPSIGAEEYESCASNDYGCQFNSDCCIDSCVNNVCQYCTTNGNSCTISSQCCSNNCSGSVCANLPISGGESINGSFKITGMCNIQ